MDAGLGEKCMKEFLATSKYKQMFEDKMLGDIRLGLPSTACTAGIGG